MQTTLRALVLAISSCMGGAPALAQEALKPFTFQSTVNDFALECQHPIKKTHGLQRNALCVSYINSAVLQIALAKRSPECWADLEAGKAAPGPIMDVLFYIAAQPEQRTRQLATELRTVVTEVAAKACK
jgi:hypothetical protein